MQVKPTRPPLFSFFPGQFCQIKNPTYLKPEEARCFSIASAPHESHLEFAFKVYGSWTKQLGRARIGDSLHISGPFGKFTWSQDLPNAVFLAGGIGITPFISMLRSIQRSPRKSTITLLYGNRTEADIAYRSEIQAMVDTLPQSKVIHILSNTTSGDSWTGYRGFFSKEILLKEIAFDKSPSFFVCGPPPFVTLSEKLLDECNVDRTKVKREFF